MQITKNSVLPIFLTGLALLVSSPQAESGLEQVSNRTAVRRIQQKANDNGKINDLINMIKSYNHVDGNFVQGQFYTALGHNEELDSDITFAYTESGPNKNLEIRLFGKKYISPAESVGTDEKPVYGTSYLTIRQQVTNGQNYSLPPEFYNRIEIPNSRFGNVVYNKISSSHPLFYTSAELQVIYNKALASTRLLQPPITR